MKRCQLAARNEIPQERLYGKSFGWYRFRCPSSSSSSSLTSSLAMVTPMGHSRTCQKERHDIPRKIHVSPRLRTILLPMIPLEGMNLILTLFILSFSMSCRSALTMFSSIRPRRLTVTQLAKTSFLRWMVQDLSSLCKCNSLVINILFSSFNTVRLPCQKETRRCSSPRFRFVFCFGDGFSFFFYGFVSVVEKQNRF